MTVFPCLCRIASRAIIKKVNQPFFGGMLRSQCGTGVTRTLTCVLEPSFGFLNRADEFHTLMPFVKMS